jgi:hypothetical protein
VATAPLTLLLQSAVVAPVKGAIDRIACDDGRQSGQEA